jgi:4-hydroxybenzoate polyprenyltransferase
MVDRDDDLRLNIKTSAITLGRWDVLFVMLCYLVFLGVWAAVLLPRLPGPWFCWALVAALLQVAWHGWLIRSRSRTGCFRAFRLNHWLGLTLFIGVLASYGWS